MKTKLIPLLFMTLLALPALGQAPKAKRPNPLAPISDAPGRPRVLLIGDSISYGYKGSVGSQLNGEANVDHIGWGNYLLNGLTVDIQYYRQIITFPDGNRELECSLTKIFYRTY